MTVREVIEAFARGMQSGGASKCKSYPQGRLRIEGNKLYNYDTVIAYWFNGIMLINGTKYSKTTSVHQNRLKKLNVKKIVVDETILKEVMQYGSQYMDIIKDILTDYSKRLCSAPDSYCYIFRDGQVLSATWVERGVKVYETRRIL